jgi:hypothetical protein
MLQGNTLPHQRINLATELVIRATTESPSPLRGAARADRPTTME